MSFQQQFETELDLLEQEFEADDMTPAEYRAAMRELEEDCRLLFELFSTIPPDHPFII